MGFVIKPCKTRVAKKLEPHRKLDLDLMKLQLPFEVLARTPGIVVLDVDGSQVSLYKNGSMLIQHDNPLPLAEKVMECLV